ncbi:Protein SOK1 [Grifola frondosa]|uniref:Protein SOK1 n=1 Tax=Grifola frondosa TaxID=5627 RepID=A0A1C7M3Y3_GRIFR|nr:Protein SOK1 [Grifola frondosa]
MSSSNPPSPPPTFIPQVRHEGPSRPKRPRIDIPHSSSTSPRRIVSATEPGPCRGSLLRAGNLPSALRSCQSVPVSPIEPISPHIPPHQPPINRETLKELDLEAILRNPQLRHDLLFDSGLQFRPTSSRRKRDLADNYWLAIVRELECGCTCTTLDTSGRPRERRCICSALPMPIGRPILAFSQPDSLVTVRAASRIRPLLRELLEVLVSIIQPPPALGKPAGLYIQPAFEHPHPQFQQNLTHVAQLRAVLDADLIQQEIAHGLFDPSGVFQTIGDVIRCHCAPMRDHAVDQMVALAHSCAPGGKGTKVDAVRAIRMCFEIMELMKLDVANHQLQTLRPYLVQSAAQYELKTFQESRQSGQLSLDVTRAWLNSAYRELSDASKSKSNLLFAKYPHRTRIHVAITKAIVNIIFDPPTPTAIPSPSTSTLPSPSTASSSISLPSPANSTPVMSPSSHRPTPSITAYPGYPETMYLDHARLLTLSKDAADFTALYMFLLLYRQLVHSSSGTAAGVKPDELLRLKKEIWEIGPAHLGLCFRVRAREGRDREAEWCKWHKEMSDVVLQVAMRACEGTGAAPDEQTVKLATSWAETHLRADSPLSALMRGRVKERVEDVATQIVLAASGATQKAATDDVPATSSGLEPLMPEIRHLAERLVKVATIHLNVYGALYAQPGFVGVDTIEWQKTVAGFDMLGTRGYREQSASQQVPCFTIYHVLDDDADADRLHPEWFCERHQHRLLDIHADADQRQWAALVVALPVRTGALACAPPPSSSFWLTAGSLHRFTFLATLFLLLFVSSAIVMRGFYLRRRFRRQLEAAIAAGALVESPGDPRARRRLRRPKLWDASLQGARRGLAGWEDIMVSPLAPLLHRAALSALPTVATCVYSRLQPVAASLCVEKPPSASPPTPPSARIASARRNPLAFFRRNAGALAWRARRRAPSSASPPRSPTAGAGSGSAPDAESEARAEAAAVQVSVLVSMPNPHRRIFCDSAAQAQDVSMKGKERGLEVEWDEDEEGVPDVVFGITRVGFRSEDGADGDG